MGLLQSRSANLACGEPRRSPIGPRAYWRICRRCMPLTTGRWPIIAAAIDFAADGIGSPTCARWRLARITLLVVAHGRRSSRAAFGSAQAGRLQLRAGRTAWPDLPQAPDANAWQRLERDGYKIRPRALTTTLFARLLIGDLFIHGIGGAKYDEVTDQIVSRLFGFDPPGYAVVSGTLRLPFQRFPATEDSLRAARRRLRELDWNPQRVVTGSAQKHRELASLSAGTSVERRARFHALRELNSQLRPLVAGEKERATALANRAAAEVAANAILASREYSFILHSETRLREFLTRSVQN